MYIKIKTTPPERLCNIFRLLGWLIDLKPTQVHRLSRLLTY